MKITLQTLTHQYGSSPCWCYLVPLLHEECEWFSDLKSRYPYGHLMQRFWLPCFQSFMGWLSRHSEYFSEDSPRFIHGVSSARCAFETFSDPECASGQALWAQLEYLESLQKHETESIGTLIRKHYEQLVC